MPNKHGTEKWWVFYLTVKILGLTYGYKVSAYQKTHKHAVTAYTSSLSILFQFFFASYPVLLPDYSTGLHVRGRLQWAQGLKPFQLLKGAALV